MTLDTGGHLYPATLAEAQEWIRRLRDEENLDEWSVPDWVLAIVADDAVEIAMGLADALDERDHREVMESASCVRGLQSACHVLSEALAKLYQDAQNIDAAVRANTVIQMGHEPDSEARRNEEPAP